jgi:hypothetical protein
MQLAEETGLSYGKVYRILNGTLKNPGPVYLKKLSESLNLNYSQLLNLTGVISSYEDTQSELACLPLLTWEYCYLAYPFNEPITAGLADEHCYYHEPIKDGFGVIVDRSHQLNPYFIQGDLLICNPNAKLKKLDQVIYCEENSKVFKFGTISDDDGKHGIQSLHQEHLNCNIVIDDSIQNPIVAKIIAIKSL